MMSGCAKVTDEQLPCTGTKPSQPRVQSQVVVASGGNNYVTAQADPGTTLIWTGPNNFKYSGSELYLNFYNNTNYGTYSVKAVSGGCESDPATFQVSSTLSVPCSVPNNYTLTSTLLGNDYYYYDPNFYHTSYSGAYRTVYSNSPSGSRQLDIYFSSSTTPNVPTISDLDSTSAFSSGDCYVSYGTSHSVSGKIYLTYSNGDIIMTLCNARFKTAQGQYFTVIGAVSAQW